MIEYKNSGHTFAEVYAAFGVRSQRYYAWKAEIEAKGKFEYHYPKTHKGKVDISKLNKLLIKHPDWYLREFAAEFGVSITAIHKRFKAGNIVIPLDNH